MSDDQHKNFRSKRATSNSCSGLKIVVPEPVFKKVDNQIIISLIGRDNALIVDVRDEDYEGGHVKGSIHRPFSSFENDLPSLLSLVEEKASSLDTIVFYCMYSEQRAPQCATTFAEKISGNKSLEHLKIIIPSGGFNAILKKYLPPNEYIEEYNADFYFEVDGQLLHKIDAQYLEAIAEKNVEITE